MKKTTGSILINGGVGVLATDTLYGLVGRAFDPKAVHKIYQLKLRTPNKPFIILIGSVADLTSFGINVDKRLASMLNGYWPGPISIILPCPGKKFEYLHRGTGKLAFRMPRKATLRGLIKQTGPLVAPSANPEGMPPATNIPEARKYFGNSVDFYQAGKFTGRASKLIKLTDYKETILRA